MNAASSGANPDTAALPPAPEVDHLEVGLLQNFVTVLWCPDTKEAAVVDPAFEVDRILNFASDRGLSVKTVLVTHTHPDHIEGVGALVAATGAVVRVGAGESARVRQEAGERLRGLEPIADRQDVAIGRRGVRALHTPGHTPAGTCYLADGFVVTGDVLFIRGCGRTDFPGGDTAAMWSSLQRLAALPEETRVYPGHDYGPTRTSTIGQERQENPYLRCDGLESFRALRERPRKP